MSNSSQAVVNYALLDDFALLKASGADAFEFLQNQLTQDLELTTTQQAKLSTWCNAKGRSLASFIVWQDAEAEDSYYLLLKKDLLDSTLKRLKMFILRNKVILEEVPTSIIGLWSADHELNFAPEDLAQKANFAVYQHDLQQWIRFPSQVTEQRYLVISRGQKTAEITTHQYLPKSSDFEWVAADASYWTAFDIINGVAWVEQANYEAFIPQSINYDAIGAISFKKGCFPGQEVVARSHYRGTLKRRSYIGFSGTIKDDITVGADIYQNNEPVGQVVNIAHLPESKGTWVLFETRLEAVDGTNTAPLHLGAADGPELSLQAPPYPLEKPEN
ncbi:tRNA-modifying protein YgfZ [Oligella sp. MSHR50489EDL]|uniref:CAF17-like 4Fe-4S cluster assembly/insertion protein YgfZ n=1 Tax=Oligella sp. MSHR50489EDL TaxID=3139409 RepID=UPI003D817E36